MTQADALSILKTGANVFLTGEPGSGKTHTINAYVEWLRERGVEPAVTASTGIAATHVGGMTIHAWSGIGVLRTLSRFELDRISNTERTARRIQSTHILIVDEISMLSAETLDMIDMVCRTVRMRDLPFGGLQIIFVGDFFQLPPISREGTVRFAFDSRAWVEASPVVCYLSEQHRQEDTAFLNLLTAIRAQNVLPEHRELLTARRTDDADIVFSEDGTVSVTRLYTHNASVDHMNDATLAALPGRSVRYQMQSKGSPQRVENLKRGCLSPETLELKEGARVMFTKNDPAGRYANGSLGTVVDFSAVDKHPRVELLSGVEVVAEPVEWKMDDAGKTLARISQVPLRLAWAMTVHKSQGMSLDAALVDLSAAFEYGQGYVALSRVRSLQGLSLYGMNERALMVHPAISKKDRDFREASGAAEAAGQALGEAERSQIERNFIKAIGGVEDLKSVAKRRAQKRALKVPTLDATLALVRAGESLRAIAQERGVKVETIVDHLEQLKAAERITYVDLERFREEGAYVEDIQAAFKKLKTRALKTLHRHFNGAVSYTDIRLARLLLPD